MPASITKLIIIAKMKAKVLFDRDAIRSIIASKALTKAPSELETAVVEVVL
jgi:hypothetical protein